MLDRTLGEGAEERKQRNRAKYDLRDVHMELVGRKEKPVGKERRSNQWKQWKSSSVFGGRGERIAEINEDPLDCKLLESTGC